MCSILVNMFLITKVHAEVDKGTWLHAFLRESQGSVWTAQIEFWKMSGCSDLRFDYFTLTAFFRQLVILLFASVHSLSFAMFFLFPLLYTKLFFRILCQVEQQVLISGKGL